MAGGYRQTIKTDRLAWTERALLPLMISTCAAAPATTEKCTPMGRMIRNRALNSAGTACAVILTACSDSYDRANRAEPFAVGRSEAELVREVGSPTQARPVHHGDTADPCGNEIKMPMPL